MKTKLVYVLTCDPENHYIEQALISVFSARYWNPDAYIILIVDDMTDQLLVGKRSELLGYISEKIVIPFKDPELSSVYRSRWIKTSVRHFIKGRYLFIDCDTIVCRSLEQIDTFACDIGAVWDAHLLVEDFCDNLIASTKAANISIGVDIEGEKEYFSSGVLFVQDTPNAHQLYLLWHEYWEESCQCKLFIDQPAMAKANREMGHIIQRIPDIYNCIVFTHNAYTRDAIVLHLSSYRNPSFIFSEKVLKYVQKNGLNNEWLIASILNPCSTFLPFDYDVLHSTAKQRKKWRKEIALSAKGYSRFIDSSFDGFPMPSRFRWIVVALLRNRWFGLGAGLWMLWKRKYVLSHKKVIKENVCRK